MPTLTKTVCFDDIDTQNCPDISVDELCDILTSIVKKVAALHASHVTIDLKDLYIVKNYKPHLNPFILNIERKFFDGIPLWYATFSNNTALPLQQLSVIVSLED